MRIVAVDPGKKTGWAMYDTSTHDLVGAWEASGDEFLDIIVPWLHEQRDTDVLLAVERFVISGGTVEKGRTDENWSIEQIGVLRHHARWDEHTFELQGAGDAKRFAPNPRLKDLGWYVPGKGHANDALRHALLAVGRHDVQELDYLLTTNTAL